MPYKKFNIYKFIQAVSLLQKETKSTNYMKLLKLMFFADRYHIRNYGFLLTFDDYCALLYGPVGSQSKDILTMNDYYYENLEKEDKQFLNNKIEKIKRYDVKINEEKIELSKSKIEALEFSIKNFGKFTQFELSEITHDYPEWKRYKELFENKETTQEIVIINDFFENINLDDSPYVRQYLEHDPFEEDIEYLQFQKEDFFQENKCR